MRILVAADKFKDALTAAQACDTIAAGLKRAPPEWVDDLFRWQMEVKCFSHILTVAAQGEWVQMKVAGLRGKPVEARFGVVEAVRLPPAGAATNRVFERGSSDGDRDGGGGRQGGAL